MKTASRTGRKSNKIEKDILEVLEDELNKYLPEVFAIVRDTARRFAQNESIEVTASDFDRELAPKAKTSLKSTTAKPSTTTTGWQAETR